jgi:hypothetical protein
LSDLRREAGLCCRGRVLYKLHSGGRDPRDPEIDFKGLALMHNLDVLPQRDSRLDTAVGLLGIAKRF